MATGIKLTKAQLRALRILGDHEWVRAANQTTEGVDDQEPLVDWQTARDLMNKAFGSSSLARWEWRSGYVFWQITGGGRQVLAELDTRAS